MKNKLTIVKNWDKALTLSKKQIGRMKAGNPGPGGGTCGNYTKLSKEKKSVPSKDCRCWNEN